AVKLEAPLSRDEIRKVVWGCDKNKSLGPDGFTFEFFRKFWDVVGPDLCIVVEWFFEHCSFSKGCNSSFIALIPKNLDSKIVSDYNPISLIRSLYMVVTNILANRLTMVISDLISDLQTAFLPNRHILDAYDSIRRDFLDDVLNCFGFGCKWRSWIRGNLKSGMASILINGSPTSEFQFHSGLKQGDPLASYLFILVMEALHLSFSRAINAGIFTGVGVPTPTVMAAAATIGCSIMETPFNYLGIMVGGNMSLIKSWDDTAVLHSMEAIRRNFFNGIQDDERKIAWVKWSKVLASKKQRGLGVSSFHALNRALLVKWMWRFLSRDNSLWFWVISAVHGLTILESHTYYSSTWSSIVKEINLLKDHGVDLISHCRIRVGNVLRTSLWNDPWIGDSLLRYEFPRLYALDNFKYCTVADKLHGSISFSFRREARGAEAHQRDLLLDLIELAILSNMEDRWTWDLNGDGVFRVRDVRNLLDTTFLPTDVTPTMG
nr:RNA-directed DNA polymerase, eukaryota [Tanacetum cinerariifolium]